MYDENYLHTQKAYEEWNNIKVLYNEKAKKSAWEEQ